MTHFETITLNIDEAGVARLTFSRPAVSYTHLTLPTILRV